MQFTGQFLQGHKKSSLNEDAGPVIGQKKLIIAQVNLKLHFDGAENLSFVVQSPEDKANFNGVTQKKKRWQGWLCSLKYASPGAKSCERDKKLKEKNFFAGLLTGYGDLYTVDGLGPEITYPPFLWITMCMNA